MAKAVTHKYRPPPPFDAWIQYLWYAEGGPQAYRRQSVLPSGIAVLAINLADDRLRIYTGPEYAERRTLPGIALSGPTTCAFAIDAHLPRMLGVQFRAGGAHAFLGPVISELRDAHVALEDLWGARARELHGRLADARSIEAKFRVLFGALVNARAGLPSHPAVGLALARFREAPLETRVRSVAAEAQLNSRRFIELFVSEVGLTPKRYLRVVRFQRVLRQIHGAPRIDWSGVAYACGYSDQSHFIREFKEFSGLTPSQYRERATAGRNHAALDD